MTERRGRIARFEPPDEDGNIGVVVAGKLAGKLHRRGREHLFIHRPAHPEAAGWSPETDELAELHGLDMGRNVTIAKDHVLAFRTGQLGWEWAIPSIPHLHGIWYAKGRDACPRGATTAETIPDLAPAPQGAPG